MDDKTAEEREEARLNRSLARASGGKAPGTANKAKKWSEKHPEKAAEPVGIPVNRVEDDDDEEDNRDARPTEAGKIRGASTGDDDDRFASLIDPVSAEDIRREKTIIAAAKGELTPDRKNVQEAVAAEKERLASIFRVQHDGRKQAWALPANEKVRKEKLENEKAALAAEREQAEAEAQHKATLEAAMEARRQLAASDVAAAKAHYSDPNVSEPYLNDLELDMCEALVRLRKEPNSFVEPLKIRRDRIEGITYHFVCNDGIEQNVRVGEGKRAVNDALSFVEMEAGGEALPSLRPSKGLTKALYKAYQSNPDKPQAMKLIQDYGKVSGSARQLSYHGPCGTAEDILCGILIDDGNTSRNRRKGIMDPKFRKFGVCGGMSADGKSNYMFILLASNFEDNE